MKNKNVVWTVAFSVLSLFSAELYGQEQNEVGKTQIGHADSLDAASQKEIQTRKAKDESTIADYRYDRNRTKAKAKEAQRVQSEANTAARESRYALRAERRAQKARRDADRQAEKASNARVRSDRN